MYEKFSLAYEGCKRVLSLKTNIKSISENAIII